MTEQTGGSSPTPAGLPLTHSAGMDRGMRVLSYLIGGVLLYGGLGWLGDHLLGTGFLLPLGIVLGAALSVYVIIRRFGQVTTEEGVPSRTDRFRSTLAHKAAARSTNQKVGLP